MEFTAKSIEEAKATAAAKLGVAPEAVTITVLEETKGLFGKMNLRVRAEAVAPAAAPAPAAEEEKPKKPAARGRAKKEEAPVEAAPAVEEEAPAAPAAEEEKPKGRGRGPKKEAAAAEAPARAPREPRASREEGDEPVATQEDADKILDLVGGILDATELEVDLSIAGFQGKYVSLKIEGKDAGHMVGKSGEVLNQLQYLMNVILTHQLKNGIRVTVDGDDFRQKREEQLTKYATKIAEQVQSRGEEAVLEALPAFERRVIHKALADLGTVKTYSEGEEPNRRVVIAPLD